MKAEINGIKLEGTPQEIYDFIKLKSLKEESKQKDFDIDKFFKKHINPYPPNPYFYGPSTVYCKTATNTLL